MDLDKEIEEVFFYEPPVKGLSSNITPEAIVEAKRVYRRIRTRLPDIGKGEVKRFFGGEIGFGWKDGRECRFSLEFNDQQRWNLLVHASDVIGCSSWVVDLVKTLSWAMSTHDVLEPNSQVH